MVVNALVAFTHEVYTPITLSSAELIGNSGEGSLLSTALTLHYAH